jgi:hypothetical protein
LAPWTKSDHPPGCAFYDHVFEHHRIKKYRIKKY